MAISMHCADGRKKADIDADLEIKFLDASHIGDIIALQEVVARHLVDREIFRLTLLEEFEDLLSQEDLALGVLADDSLIAYNLVSIPRGADNFGIDIGLAREEQEKVAHIKAVVVHPAYRGNGFQRILAEVHLGLIRERGYRHVCSTVSPKNLISIENHFANGFVIKAIKMKYGGMLRYIMHRNLVRPFSPGENAVGIKVDDIDGQKRLIDDGLSGFKAQYHVGDFRIEYARDIGQNHDLSISSISKSSGQNLPVTNNRFLAES